MDELYRPWGSLHWLLERLPRSRWHLLGALATEDRSLTCWEVLKSQNAIQETRLLEILDFDPQGTHTQTSKVKRDANRERYIRAGGQEGDVERHELFEKHELILGAIQQFVSRNCENVVLDISCLPKLFFFPFVKYLILHASTIKNLMVTYTAPQRYNPVLSEDFEKWRPLPSFMLRDPEPDDKAFIIGLGYAWQGFALPVLGPILENTRIHVLFPFPPGPPHFQKNWEAMRRLEINYRNVIRAPVRIHAFDLPAIVKQLYGLTDNGSRYVIFGPYGPKTMSLGICLFATRFNSAVCYTQPKLYHPDYSTGVGEINGRPEVYAYCLRLNGRDLY